jgi:hypothetical protein
VRIVLEERPPELQTVRVGEVRQLGLLRDTHPRGATERRKTVRSGFPTKDGAERELLRMLEAVETGTYIAPSKLTLERYLPSWLEGKTHLRPSTHETYGILIERYICNPDYGIGTAPLWSLTRPGIRRFYVELERRGRLRGRRANESQGRAQHPPGSAKGPGGRRGGRPDPHESSPACPQAGSSPPGGEDLDGGAPGFLPRARSRRSAPRAVTNRRDHRDAPRRGSRPHVAGFDPVARRLHVTQALVKGPGGGPPRFGPPKTDRGRRAVPLDGETVRVACCKIIATGSSRSGGPPARPTRVTG